MNQFNDMDTADFAELTLDCLDAQQKYFRTRGQLALEESKRLEAKLRKTAEGILEMCRRRRGPRRLSEPHQQLSFLPADQVGGNLPD